ncbi:MAG: hypothetical protein IKZ28_01975, partial [Clostridia bacterium]|nr:hypothetical protein [Clostridia bacterium]
MKIDFKRLTFEVINDVIVMKKCGSIESDGWTFVEVQITGENKDTHMGAKMARSSEGRKLRYVSHDLEENRLTILQKSELIEVASVFECYGDADAISSYTIVKNISQKEIVLEEVSSFMALGVGASIDVSGELYFTRFTQSHHGECQPRRFSFKELGLFRANWESQKRIAFANVGSWSTKEELPQGIIEDEKGNFLMFQIESNSSWYYEISDVAEKYYLYLGGANLPFGGWSKALQPQEEYATVKSALSFGKSVEGVIGEMTKY